MSRSDKPSWALVIPWDTTDPGGVSQVVENLAEALAADGTYAPIVIVQDWNAARVRQEWRNGVRYLFLRLRLPADRVPGLTPVRRLFYRLCAAIEHRRIRKLLRAFDVRILNFHFPSWAAEPFLAGRRDWRVIFSLHGQDIVGASQLPPPQRSRFMRMLQAGDATVSVSEGFARKVAEEIAPELAGRLSTVHNGVSPARLAGTRAAPVDLPRNYILNVATFEAKKGQRYLIDAFAMLAPRQPDLHLVIVGRLDSALPEIEACVESSGLRDRVLLLRDLPHAEMVPFFAGARLFCLSSLMEPFGIVLLEAGLFSLPVVATRVGGVPEVMRADIDGLLVEPGSAAALAQAMQALLDAPEHAARLGAALRARVLAEFSWARAAKGYVALAAGLQDPRGRRTPSPALGERSLHGCQGRV